MRFNISKNDHSRTNFHLSFITDTDTNKEENEGRVGLLLREWSSYSAPQTPRIL